MTNGDQSKHNFAIYKLKGTSSIPWTNSSNFQSQKPFLGDVGLKFLICPTSWDVIKVFCPPTKKHYKFTGNWQVSRIDVSSDLHSVKACPTSVNYNIQN